jgi:hypothetical protein
MMKTNRQTKGAGGGNGAPKAPTCSHRFIIRTRGSALAEAVLHLRYPNPDKWIKCPTCKQTYYDQHVIRIDSVGLKAVARDIVRDGNGHLALENIQLWPFDTNRVLMNLIALELERQRNTVKERNADRIRRH